MTTAVKAFRLVNNEEVLGQVLGTSPEEVHLKNPAILGMVPGQNGQPSLGLADYLPMCDTKELVLKRQHILFEYEPQSKFITAYNATFSSLVLPQKGLILG